MSILTASRKPKAQKPIRIPERDVTKACVSHMITLGYTFERRNAGIANFGERGRVSYGKSGASDAIFVHPFRPAVYIEFKASDESLPHVDDALLMHIRHPKSRSCKRAYEQAKFLHDKRTAGFRAFWVNSLEMLKEEMRRP